MLGGLRHVLITRVPMGHVHLHLVLLGVHKVLRSRLLDGSPVEVDHLEDVGTLEGTSEQERPLTRVVKGEFHGVATVLDGHILGDLFGLVVPQGTFQFLLVTIAKV